MRVGKKTPKAQDKLESLMDSENEGIALKASLAIIERAYGKPRQEIDMTTNQPIEPPVFNIVSFTDGKGKETPCRVDGHVLRKIDNGE